MIKTHIPNLERTIQKLNDLSTKSRGIGEVLASTAVQALTMGRAFEGKHAKALRVYIQTQRPALHNELRGASFNHVRVILNAETRLNVASSDDMESGCKLFLEALQKQDLERGTVVLVTGANVGKSESLMGLAAFVHGTNAQREAIGAKVAQQVDKDFAATYAKLAVQRNTDKMVQKLRLADTPFSNQVADEIESLRSQLATAYSPAQVNEAYSRGRADGWDAARIKVGMTEMVDAAMIAMRNIVPPLRRSDCEHLIAAALTAQEISNGSTPEKSL